MRVFFFFGHVFPRDNFLTGGVSLAIIGRVHSCLRGYLFDSLFSPQQTLCETCSKT